MTEIKFPATWIDENRFEEALSSNDYPHEKTSAKIVFSFPFNCKVMIGTAVRLLSLANQLDHCCKNVVLDFAEGESGAMGYLNRMGFFDHLAPGITVIPDRPILSGAFVYGRTNRNLVEIEAINKSHRDQSLPSRLTDTLMESCSGRTDANELEGAAWTIFAELIDNIFSHSQTPLDGYAASQLYRNGNSLKVVVSDSGLGIMETLRPSLHAEYPNLVGLSDLQLLVEIFRQGISRHGGDRGCGLRGSAQKAIKFNANLEVRLPKVRSLLVPAQGTYQPNNKAYCSENLPLIWGTHIIFDFHLDQK